MFGEQKLAITFGPVPDVLLLIAVILIIFVYGSAAVNMIINEVTSWFRKDVPDEKYAQTGVLYEVLWSKYLPLGGDEQLRISGSVEEATLALVQENGEGFIRYRPISSEKEYNWGMAMWREEPIDPVKELLTYAAQDLDTTLDIFKGSNHIWPTPEPAEFPERPTYIIEWGTDRGFEPGSGASFLTQYPETKIKEIIDELGPGYIRYKLANDDSENPWIPNGYVTKELINATTDSTREAG